MSEPLFDITAYPGFAETLHLLQGKRLLITGPTGFFGKWLLEVLWVAHYNLSLEFELVLLSRNPLLFLSSFPQYKDCPWITWVAGDIRSFDYPCASCDFVIHAATETSSRSFAEDPRLMTEVIVEGTRRVLDFARHADVQKLLYISSGAVYGKQPAELTHVGEDYSGEQDPVYTVYGQAKRMAERLCASHAQQCPLHWSSARCFALVGPYLPLDVRYAIGNFIRNVLRGEPIEIKGDGTTIRSYMYAADLTAWLLTILLRGQCGRAYNVGSDLPISIADLASLVLKVTGGKQDVVIRSTPIPGQSPDRYVPSIERVRQELQLTLTIDLATAIQRTVAWHRSIQESYEK